MNAITKALENNHGLVCNPIEEWGKHIEGCCAEAAVAQYLDMYDWYPSVGVFKSQPDVGKNEVRYRAPYAKGKDLIVRPGDSLVAPFVNVTGRFGVYQIHGWFMGADAMQKRYWKTPGNDRPGMWCVPNSQLHPMSELPA